MALTREQIAQLYVSIFDRAPEGEGMRFWLQQDKTVAEMAEWMLMTDDAKSYFGTVLYDNQQFVEFVYENTLGKTVLDDPEGVAFWVDSLNSGRYANKGEMISALIYAATQPENAGLAQEQFNNRVELSLEVSEKIEKAPANYKEALGFKTKANPYGNLEVDYSEDSLIDAEETINKLANINEQDETQEEAEDEQNETQEEAEDKQDETQEEAENEQDSATVKVLDDLPQKSDPEVATLISGYEWKDKIVTFSFNQTIPQEYQNHQESYKITNNWQPFDERDKEIAREAMKKIEEFSGLKLVEVSTGGDIRFNKVDMNYGENGFTLLPTSDNDPLAGDVWISNLYNSETQGGNTPQSYGYMTILHEIGHALGLKHPFEDSPILPQEKDNTNYTIMSYTPKNNTTLDFSVEGNQYSCKTDIDAMPSNYQKLDMEAIIATYGANLEYHKGDDVYKLSQLYNNHQYFTIWDAGGEDTIDISEVTHDSIINLNSDKLSSIDFHSISEQEEKTVAELGAENNSQLVSWIHDAYNDPQCSQGNGIYTGADNLAIVKGVIIENVVSGSGDDSIFDNSASNKISAGAGDDQIYLSYGGYDIVDGGEGVDTVFIQKAHAEIYLKQNQSSGDVSIFDAQSDEIIAELSGVEKIHLTDEVLDII